MKTYSRFILKSFASPFIATFFISLFVLLMQFLWKYIDYIVGKGLEWTVIAKLLIYVSASLVPMALPLSILLSSLMTFGNLGEQYELVAFKSAGISLKRVLRPLAFVAILLSITAFLFSNYWLPVANLKSKSLLYDLKHQKPTMDIQPGIFSSELNEYSIKVENKKVIDGIEHLEGVLIYKHSKDHGNRNVIISESGIMTSTPDKRYMEIKLFDGISYEEEVERNNKERKYPLRKTSFKENMIRIDLSELEFNRTDENLFKTGYQMLNLEQLTSAIDTLNKIKNNTKETFQEGVKLSYVYFQENQKKDHLIIKRGPDSLSNYFSLINLNQKQQVYISASNLCRNTKSRLETLTADQYSRGKLIRKHEIQWHKKLTLSFACLVLFLIGAPLGAIIRKGGLGMPIVISVIFFLLFHILSITGEKMAAEGAVVVAQGMWMATAILLPIGIFFTYKATTDSALFNIESYVEPFKRIFKKKDSEEK